MTDAQTPSRPAWRVRFADALTSADESNPARGQVRRIVVRNTDLRACLSALDAATERARVAELHGSSFAAADGERIAYLESRLAAAQPLVEAAEAYRDADLEWARGFSNHAERDAVDARITAAKASLLIAAEALPATEGEGR